MSMMVSFVLSFFPRDVLDEILNLTESVSEDFPSYSFTGYFNIQEKNLGREKFEWQEMLEVPIFNGVSAGVCTLIAKV